MRSWWTGLLVGTIGVSAAAAGCSGSDSGASNAKDSGAAGAAGSSSDAGGDAAADAADHHTPVSPTSYPMPQIGNAVGPDDPLSEGQYYLLYETWGGELLGGWDVQFLLDVLKKEPEFFGHQFEKFGFIPDPDDDLPIGLKRGTTDPTVATETCAPCHTGRLPDGKVWFGQPNLQIDVPRLELELDKRWVALGHPSNLSAASTARALAYGPGRFRIDSDDYPRAVPANIPVHYNLAQRSRLSTVGGARNVRTDVYLSIGAQVGFPLQGETVKVPFPDEARLDALAAFMGSHDPPPAPAQDAAQVAAGKAVFASAKCAMCHHPDDVSKDLVTMLDATATGIDRTPDADPAYPEGTVHADPYQYFMAYGDPSGGDGGVDAGGIDPRTARILQFAIQHKLTVGPTDGYVSPNLHGLWASAPYLNNGSVPTLDDLLKKQADRPATFDVEGYSFDTSVPGNGNSGHEFGTDLSATDKAALVAYLRSL